MSDDLLQRWQAARLEAMTAIHRKLGHDLRGILAPALLAADRISGHEDATVRRAAEMTIRAVERSNAALRETVLAMGERVDRGSPRPMALREAFGVGRGAHLAAALPDDALVLADPRRLALAIDSVMRHLDANYRDEVSLSARREGSGWVVTWHHGGAVAETADDAISELSIAREWLRSLGGSLQATARELRITLRSC